MRHLMYKLTAPHYNSCHVVISTSKLSVNCQLRSTWLMVNLMFLHRWNILSLLRVQHV